MESTGTVTRTGEMTGKIYKNMKMGADSVINLLSKAEDERLKSHMTALLDGYEKYAAEARNILLSEGVRAREEGAMAKMGARMGAGMKTITDSSASRLGELLMEGAVMGFCDTKRVLREYENKDCRPEAIQLTRDIIGFEEKNLNEAKEFV